MTNLHSNALIVNELCVSPEAPLFEAIGILTRGARKILLVVNQGGRLLGVVTDYDVRKAILDHVELNQPIGTIMKQDPVVARQGINRTELLTLIRNTRCGQIPVVDDNGVVVDIHFIDEYLAEPREPMGKLAVIMAGGLGQRLRPMTEHVPKPLLPVAGRPILFVLLDQLISEGFDQVVLTVNYKGDLIRRAIADVPAYAEIVDFIHEDKPLGTAGSLSLLPFRPRNSFAVLNADLLTNISFTEMMRFHDAEKSVVTMATKREKHVIPYGVIDLDGSRVTQIREKPSYTYFVNTGVYIVNPEVLDQIPNNQFHDMPDVVTSLLTQGRRVSSFPVHEYWLDIGNHDHYAQAQKDFNIHFSAQDE